MDKEKLCEMVREAFPDGCIMLNTLHDWLENNAWEILTTCYDDAEDLLRDLSDTGLYAVLEDLITVSEYKDSLAYGLICEEFDIKEE